MMFHSTTISATVLPAVAAMPEQKPHNDRNYRRDGDNSPATLEKAGLLRLNSRRSADAILIFHWFVFFHGLCAQMFGNGSFYTPKHPQELQRMC